MQLPPTDPRFLSIVKNTPCGSAKSSEKTPAPSAANATPRPHTLAQVLAQELAQEATPPTATPAPTPTPTPNPADTPTPTPLATATPEPTAEPTTTPSPQPTPAIPRAPQYPGSLAPPTPFPTGPPQATAPPLPTPTPTSTAGPVYLERATSPPSIAPVGASPSPPSNGTPEPLRTLAPNAVVAVADNLSGSTEANQPGDLAGNVHVFYQEGQIVGDKAHFDGDHTLTISGHTYLINRNQDAILYADQILFDTHTRHATLINGRGETSEGVQTGKLHYSAHNLDAASSGITHGTNASFTTCENPRGGYHVEAKQIDVLPGDKLVAHKATIFLGALAVFYVPLLVIPLRNIQDPRRQSSFLPLIGYSQLEGYYIKARLSFGTSNTYYGYYRIEYFTKRGLGLGYVAFIGTKNNRRYITIDSYTIDDHIAGGRQTNVNVQETENFSRRIRGQFGVNYTGDFGAGIDLPASENITGSIVRQGDQSTQNLTFSRFLQGTLSDNLNLGFVETLNIGKYINQQINLSYTEFNSAISNTNTVHINTLTHVFSSFADYNLTYDKTNYSTDPYGYNSEPELQILPHLTFLKGFPFIPQLQLTIGDYTEPQNHFTAGRAEIYFNQPVALRLFGNSDFTANYSIRQDLYTTGDEKAFAMQNAAISTPFGNHIVNSITYNEQNPIGPPNVPFQLLDHLSGGAHGLQDVFRFYNQNVYSISLSTGTDFDREAQPIQYQLTAQPSLRSYLVVGGFWTPGPGQGFGTTNVQVITPFGYMTSLQFSTNIDWHNHERLEDKTAYLSKIIGNCYDIQLTYNQDLQQFGFNVVLLAFPGQGAGFGLGGTGSAGSNPSILPQNFAF